MRPAFDPTRLVKLDIHNEGQQVHVTEFVPLRAAIAEGRLSPNAPVLYTQRDDTLLVFQTRHFSLYNVMQGFAGDVPWMATFCAICNAGMSFSPILDGDCYEFYGAGFYDAMVLLADKQTGSYWDHITGECLAGPMFGHKLQFLTNLTHTQADSVARAFPDAQLAVTTVDSGRAQMDTLAERLRTEDHPDWLPLLTQSLDATAEDPRLPRLELGLGIWTDRATALTPSQARFYPFQTIAAADNLLFDTINRANVMVYIDRETFTPSAIYTDAASGEWRGDAIALDDGSLVRDGHLYRDGQRVDAARPFQLFQRWYGFSLEFPGCPIYTENL